VVSILVIAIEEVARLFMIYTHGTWFKFEFTNDTNFRLFAGQYIYGKTYVYILTDMAHILHVYMGLAQGRTNYGNL